MNVSTELTREATHIKTTLTLDHEECCKLRRELNDIICVVNTTRLYTHIETDSIQHIAKSLTKSLSMVDTLDRI